MEFQFLRSASVKILPLPLLVLLPGCEKEIVVELPDTDPRIVVEGSIETGQPAFVILTRTQSFFAPTSIASIASSFISDALVIVDDGTGPDTLTRLCSAELPPDLLEQAALLTGFDPALLSNANICIWRGGPLGENGRTYNLNVVSGGEILSSTTTIPNPVPLDSLWFKLALQRPGDDSLGYIWAKLNDPDTIGNSYRWFAQRLNRLPNGQRKDPRYIAPLLSVFEDRYFNGLTFNFSYYRGRSAYASDDPVETTEATFFKREDTVAVKFTSIGKREFQFFDSYANNVLSTGDVFSNPSNVVTNINGGLGIWVGYGVHLDTVICEIVQ